LKSFISILFIFKRFILRRPLSGDLYSYLFMYVRIKNCRAVAAGQGLADRCPPKGPTLNKKQKTNYAMIM
jgi:hypothetical protein